MDSPTKSVRAFCNRSTKSSPSKTNTSSITIDKSIAQSNSANVVSHRSPSAPPTQQHKFGVRKVLKKDESQLSNAHSVLDEYKHGLENPLIKALMNSNPSLLAQCLAYRCYLKGRACGDFVLSLFLQGQQMEPRNRKRSIKCSDDSNYDDIFDIKEATGNRVNIRGKSIHSSKGGIEISSSQTTHPERFHNEANSFHPDVIVADELRYLNDVLVELQSIRKRHNDPSQPNSHPYYILDHSMILSHDSSQHSVDDESDCNDDLIWLTKQMENEWLQFLYFSGIKTTTAGASLSRHAKNEKKETENQKAHCYKAYIAMGKRNQQCDLGYFRTSEESARVYDMYAIGRRSLGKIAMKEFDLRKRVKARSYIHKLVSIMFHHSNLVE